MQFCFLTVIIIIKIISLTMTVNHHLFAALTQFSAFGSFLKNTHNSLIYYPFFIPHYISKQNYSHNGFLQNSKPHPIDISVLGYKSVAVTHQQNQPRI
jgi:hypothetical protein